MQPKEIFKHIAHRNQNASLTVGYQHMGGCESLLTHLHISPTVNSGDAHVLVCVNEVAQTRMESTESQPDDDDDMSAASAAFENGSNNIGVQERQELFNEGVAHGFQLGYAAALDQATSSEAAATTSQRQTGNLVEDTLQSPGALTGRRVPLYERSGEGKRASASG